MSNQLCGQQSSWQKATNPKLVKVCRNLYLINHIVAEIIVYYNIYCNSNVYKHTGESGSTNNDMWMLDGLLGQLQIQPPSSSS